MMGSRSFCAVLVLATIATMSAAEARGRWGGFRFVYRSADARQSYGNHDVRSQTSPDRASRLVNRNMDDRYGVRVHLGSTSTSQAAGGADDRAAVPVGTATGISTAVDNTKEKPARDRAAPVVPKGQGLVCIAGCYN